MPPVRQEPCVAATALAAASGDEGVAVVDEIGEQRSLARAHNGSLGHADHEIVATRTVALPPLTVLARPGATVRMVPEREQGCDVAIGHHDHVAAIAAVAAVGSALGDVSLATKGDRAGPTVTATEVALDLVDERRLRHDASLGTSSALGARVPPTSAAQRRHQGVTSTSLRPWRRPNCTMPSAVANKVSSPPRPTFSPGWNFVPRWRTMIAPAWTAVPEWTFTPRRFAAESRPLRDEAAPFFFDMDLSYPGVISVISITDCAWR
jgi:hypothetical protein